MLARIIATVLMWVFCLEVASAEPPKIALTGPIAANDLVGFLETLKDPDWTVTVEDIIEGQSPAFDRVISRAVDFGYTPDSIWVRAKLHNQSHNIRDWRVFIQENFLQVVNVYVVRADNTIETLLSQEPNSPFGSRPIQFGQLVAPMELKPGETATLLLQYSSGGSSSLVFEIETQASFAEAAAYMTAKNALFYGMILLLIIFAMVGMVVLRQPMFLAYAMYSGSVLIYLMHSDGVAFQYLWPNFPGFNGNASIWIGSAVCITAANCARVFVQTKIYHPTIDKILVAIMLFTFGLLIGSFIFDTQIIKKVLVLTSLISIGMCLIAGLVASRLRFKQVRFFVIAWAGAVLSAGLMSLRHWLGIDVSQEFQYDSMRFVMVFDASMMGMAIVDHYNQLRSSRQKALYLNLNETARNLRLNKRLAGLEQQYAEMIERSQSSRVNFADTIHDLRQPLNALRLNIANLGSSAPENPPSQEAVEQTFEYLEQLISKELARPEGEAAEGEKEPRFVSNHGLGLQETLARVHAMFLADAVEKGLKFRFYRSSQETAADPFIILRIASNLVANAVKYTNTGSITLGSRAVGDQLYVFVIDTGIGMTPSEFEQALQRTVRLDIAEKETVGKGLGLTIVNKLVLEHGWSLSHKTRLQGTCLCIGIPLLQNNHK